MTDGVINVQTCHEDVAREALESWRKRFNWIGIELDQRDVDAAMDGELQDIPDHVLDQHWEGFIKAVLASKDWEAITDALTDAGNETLIEAIRVERTRRDLDNWANHHDEDRAAHEFDRAKAEREENI